MKQHTILVIDDQPDNLKTIIDHLKSSGKPYSILKAPNGRIGYEIAVRRKPDLIITDWEMPEMDGLEMVKLLRKNKLTKDIPIIMATGVMTSIANLKMAFEAGATDYIKKPINEIELMARLNSTLEISDLYTKRKEQNEQLEIKNKEINEKNKELDKKVEQRTIQLKKQLKQYALLNEQYKNQNHELVIAKNKAEESDLLKTEFINNMSHEIRTPLNGILGFLDFLYEPDLSDEKKKFYINLIQSSGEQLLRVINDILEISLLGSKQVKTVNEKVCLNDLISELYMVYDLRSKGHLQFKLNTKLSSAESRIYTDEGRLRRALNSLLENACMYTNKGYVELGCRYTLESKTKMIEVYVEDTGIGINEDKLETIFKPFSQEEKILSKRVGGLGLGLSIAKENIELIGGKIKVKSEKGEGSVFSILLPIKTLSDV